MTVLPENGVVHSKHSGHSDHNSEGSNVIVGTPRDDVLYGGDGVADVHGWAGDDIVHGGILGGAISGGNGNDTLYGYGFGGPVPQRYQTHMFGDAGDDTIYMDTSRQPGDHSDFRFGHHVFGGSGSDKFVFWNVDKNDQRIVGRIDDFDPTQDSIWIDDQRVDLNNPPENVRIISHEGQQWILINERILYALEGARHQSSAVAADGKNAGAREEDHFLDWPEKWADGIPASADVQYRNPSNFVPARFLPDEIASANRFSPNEHHFHGTDDADRIEGSPGHGQILHGHGGDDFIFGNRGDDTIYGGPGDDYIDGYHGHDVIYGGDGNDVINGGKGHDLIYGGEGDDVIAGGSDNDTIYGGPGNDTIFGGTEDDLIFGGPGNDVLYGGPGQDRLHGGYGNDTIFGGDGNDKIWAGPGDDLVFGGNGADLIHGGLGRDSLHGGAGNDTIFAGAGDDFVWGGPGNDELHGGPGNDVMHGGPGNDVLFGGPGDDELFGGPGNDRLQGGPGNDTLSGGLGTDSLWGGTGSDTFLYNMAAQSRPGEGRDRIFDFTAGEDRLDLSRMDADILRPGQQSLTFSNSGPAANSVWIVTERNSTFVRADVDGDGILDFAVELVGTTGVTQEDFLL